MQIRMWISRMDGCGKWRDKTPMKHRVCARALVFLLLGIFSAHAESKQPNIIYIMTDDQGYGDLACHGHPFIKTPNLDKLHAQSARFTNYHVSPTCAPTRAALMSGRNPFEVGVRRSLCQRLPGRVASG